VEDGAGGTGWEVVEELWACAELGGTRAGQKTFLEKGQIPQYLEGERRLLDECACAGEGAEVYVNTMPIVPGIAALDTVESDTAASAAVQPVRADPRSVRIGLDAVQEQASSVSKECLDAAQAHTTLAQTQMGRARGTPVLIDQYYGTCYYPHQGAADELLTMCTPWTEESHLGHRREESSDTRFVQQRGGCPGRLAGKQRAERRSVSDSSLVGAPHLEALSTSHTRRTGGRRGGQPSPPMTVAPSLGVIQTRALVTGKTTPKSPSEAVKCMGVQQVGAWLASSQVGLGECARCFVDASCGRVLRGGTSACRRQEVRARAAPGRRAQRALTHATSEGFGLSFCNTARGCASVEAGSLSRESSVELGVLFDEFESVARFERCGHDPDVAEAVEENIRLPLTTVTNRKAKNT
jgi:hypothetical protein